LLNPSRLAVRADLRSIDNSHRPRCCAPMGPTFSCSLTRSLPLISPFGLPLAVSRAAARAAWVFSFPKLSVLAPATALDCGSKIPIGHGWLLNLRRDFLARTGIIRIPPMWKPIGRGQSAVQICWLSHHSTQAWRRAASKRAACLWWSQRILAVTSPRRELRSSARRVRSSARTTAFSM